MVQGESIDVDACASLKYEIGRGKQEREFSVVPEMNRNIILGRDWLKQFHVCMYYDLGCIRIGKSYVKMEEDINISSLARLTAHTIIRLQTGKFCLYIAKSNEQLFNSKFHQVIPTEDSNIMRDPSLLTVNSIVKQVNKASSQCSLSTILINFFSREKEVPLVKLKK